MGKKLLFVLGFVALVVSLAYFGAPQEENQGLSMIRATLGGVSLVLEVVDTPLLQAKGLSGHTPLEKNTGMLFVFDRDDRHAFWMKDMTFPIDIVWLDKNYAIVDVWERADPASYPEARQPRSDARFVVELPANFFQEHRLKVGNILEIRP